MWFSTAGRSYLTRCPVLFVVLNNHPFDFSRGLLDVSRPFMFIPRLKPHVNNHHKNKQKNTSEASLAFCLQPFTKSFPLKLACFFLDSNKVVAEDRTVIREVI